jgi:hypothetical protein
VSWCRFRMSIRRRTVFGSLCRGRLWRPSGGPCLRSSRGRLRGVSRRGGGRCLWCSSRWSRLRASRSWLGRVGRRVSGRWLWCSNRGSCLGASWRWLRSSCGWLSRPSHVGRLAVGCGRSWCGRCSGSDMWLYCGSTRHRIGPRGRLHLRAGLGSWRGLRPWFHRRQCSCARNGCRVRRGRVVGSGQRAGRYQRLRTAMVHRRKLSTVACGLVHMLNLRRNRRYALLVQHREFGRCRPNIESAGATGIAHSGSSVIRDVVVVDIVNDRGIHIVDGAVVVERTSVPIAALIAAAHITEPIIDTAIVANVRTPIPMAPEIAPANERPIRRRPERADVRSNDPCSRNPVITAGSVSPVTGSP